MIALLKRSDWESIKNKIGIAFLPGGYFSYNNPI